MPSPDNNNSDRPEASNRLALSDKDVRDAARLLRIISDPASLRREQPEPPADEAEAADRETLTSRARMLYSSRRLRERYFDRQLFAEPAWDMLLLLYVTEHSSARLTTTRLAELIDTPLTTVLRWLNHLEAAQLIERQGHPTDRRTTFIGLPEKGRAALESYLRSISG